MSATNITPLEVLSSSRKASTSSPALSGGRTVMIMVRVSYSLNSSAPECWP